MKTATATLLVAVFLSACAAIGTAPREEHLRLRLLAFNDFHGHLQVPAPVRLPHPYEPSRSVLVGAGGAAHLASAIREARQDVHHSIVVAAGDLVSASPLISSLFFDEPAIEVLNVIGLEIASVGNHEFDRGRQELLRLAHGGCRAEGCITGEVFAGAKFAYLAANVRDSASGKSLLPPYVVREFDGISVAFIGLTLKDTPAIVSKAGISGLRFGDEVAVVNALVPQLKTRGVEAIVVLIHQGGVSQGAYNDPGCPGFEGAIIPIVERFDKAVDVVISGHTHQAYLCRVDGRLVTSAGAYGRFLSVIDIEIDRASRDVVRALADNLLVDPARFTADPDVTALVGRYAALAAPRADRVVGTVTGELPLLANAAGESALGNVIADAQLAATRAAGAQIAFTNPGGIRAPLYSRRQDNGVTFGDIFTVQPFGNDLVTMTLSGAQILRVLEQQFPRDRAQRTRIMPVSRGFSYAWDASPPAGKRVVEGSLRLDGERLRAGQHYRVTVNSFMAGGGDAFTVFSEGRDREGGPLDVDALEAFVRANSPLQAPKMGRITRLD